MANLTTVFFFFLEKMLSGQVFPIQAINFSEPKDIYSH